MTSASRYIAAVLLLGGCSVINSFDDVKPALKTDAGTGAGGKGGKTGAGGRGGTDASAAGGSTAGGGAGGDTGGAGGAAEGTGGKGGVSGAPTDSGAPDVFVPGGEEAVIVAYSKPAAPAIPELLVLDAGNGGNQLNHEPMGAVKGILNDPQTDIWYIFEQKGTVTDPVILHVRELNTVTGAWLEIGTKSGVPFPASRIVAMNGRIAYLSTPTPVSPDQATHTLTILDTTDPTKVSVLGGVAGEHRPLPAGRKQTLVARPTSVGGTIDVAYFSSTCPVGDAGVAECDVSLAAYPVDDKAIVTTTPTTKVVGKVLTSSSIQLERDSIRDAVVLLLPALVTPTLPDCSDPLTAPDQGSVQKFSPLDFSGVGQATVNYKIESQQISGAAYDACFDIGFVTTQLYDRAIWGIPLAGGAPIKKCSGTGGASMLFEPRARLLIRAPTGGGTPEFFALGGTSVAPTLTAAAFDKLPAKFTPISMATRHYKAGCPK